MRSSRLAPDGHSKGGARLNPTASPGPRGSRHGASGPIQPAGAKEGDLGVRVRALARAATLDAREFDALIQFVDAVGRRKVDVSLLRLVVQVLREFSSLEPTPDADPGSRLEPSEVEVALAARLRSTLLEASVLASCLSSGEGAARLGVSPSWVARHAGRDLLALRGRRGAWRLPAWQFVGRTPARPVPGLSEVLATLEGTPLRKAVWLTRPREEWGGRSGAEMLRLGRVRSVLDSAAADAVAL